MLKIDIKEIAILQLIVGKINLSIDRYCKRKKNSKKHLLLDSKKLKFSIK